MTDATHMDAIEAKVLAGLRAKLGVRARTLPKAMKRAGRRLPREAHRAAEVLIQARSHMQHPKLARMVDETSMVSAQAVLERHLDQIDPKERRKDFVLSMLGAQALNVLGVAALVIGLLKWRGFL